MKNLVALAALLALVCAALLASPSARYALLGLVRKEPFYEGMPASYWKDEMRKWVANASARPRVLDGGKEAVPVLIELVKGDDLWGRVLAIRALARIGPDARDAVPTLMKVLEDRRPVDPFDEPGITLGMDWAVWPVYREAAGALGDIGPDAIAAFPALLRLRPTDGSDYTSSTIDAALKLIDPGAAAKAGVR
jgi:HEAT repeat protein